MSKELPIIFSGPMVRAILDGRKTQTRRAIKPQPHHYVLRIFPNPENTKENDGTWFRIPYAPGDLLWVREAAWYAPNRVAYAADNDDVPNGCIVEGFGRKRSPIHMPRWASRITLEVTDVRVQRLQDITEDDAKAEGVEFCSPAPRGLSGWRDYGDKDGAMTRRYFSDPRVSFSTLWNSIHGTEAWNANPFVAAYTFRRVE